MVVKAKRTAPAKRRKRGSAYVAWASADKGLLNVDLRRRSAKSVTAPAKLSKMTTCSTMPAIMRSLPTFSKEDVVAVAAMAPPQAWRMSVKKSQQMKIQV